MALPVTAGSAPSNIKIHKKGKNIMKTTFEPQYNKKYTAYVAAYMRYSSANQDEESIKYQRAAIMTYAYHRGYFVACEYIDEAKSGRTDKRDGFQEMIADSKDCPPWSKVLVYDMSRFARNSIDAAKYTAELDDLGIELISVTQEFDDSNEGFLMRGIVNLLNEYYSRNLAKHTHAGLKQKASEGKHCGGRPPLGYDIVNDQLVINEYEAEIVRLIFDMYENMFSYSQMANELNSKGYSNKQKKPFTTNSFSSILRQEKYTGTYIWNRASKKTSKGTRNNHKHKPTDAQVILKDRIPVIIDKEQFERVQEIMASRKKGTAPTKSRHFYLLSGGGFLKCAYCGSNLIGTISSSHGKKYKYYYCPKHRDNKGKDKCPCVGISAELIEPFVIRSVVSDIFHRDDLVSLYNNSDEHNKIKALTAQLKGLELSTKSLLNTTTVTYNTPAYQDACARLQEVSQQKKNIKAEIERLVAAQKTVGEDDRRQLCKDIIKMLETTNVLETKKYLKSVISSILVSNEDVNVTLNIA